MICEVEIGWCCVFQIKLFWFGNSKMQYLSMSCLVASVWVTNIFGRCQFTCIILFRRSELCQLAMFGGYKSNFSAERGVHWNRLFVGINLENDIWTPHNSKLAANKLESFYCIVFRVTQDNVWIVMGREGRCVNLIQLCNWDTFYTTGDTRGETSRSCLHRSLTR
jgi:hypothetical protein